MVEDSLVHCHCDLTSNLWNLSQEVMRKLNGCNSLMIVRITDRSVHEEERSETASFDVVKTIRVRRLR